MSEQCPVFTFGWQCLRDAGHSGEHGTDPEKPSPERAILTDLISELRDHHHDQAWIYAEVIDQAADRAEARLKGLTDE